MADPVEAQPKEAGGGEGTAAENKRVETPQSQPEIKPEETNASAAGETPKIKPSEAPVKDTPVAAVDVNVIVAEKNGKTKLTDDWQQREQELLKKIDELEKVKNARSEDGLRLELKVREEEIDLLKARVKNLETELQAALSKPSGKNHEMIENIKQQHEEIDHWC